MRFFAAFLAAALCGRAAVLQGVVIDYESGRPLARTGVVLTSLSGGPGQTARTESNGSFWFGAPPGVYLLTLAREGFATYRYGAKCWNCPGAPLFLNGDDRTAVDIRMRRLGALTGTVQDENQVGIPDIELIVYTATRPLKEAGKAKSDDRGFFRLGGLAPGPYVVRTVATETKDGMSYLASFYPEGTELRLSRTINVELERTWSNVDFPPVPGKLYRVQGRVIAPSPGMVNSIDLISDSGRDKASVDTQGNFLFDHVSPGNYDLFAEGRSASAYYAAWQPVTVEHDTEVNAPMFACGGVMVFATDEQRKPLRPSDYKVTLRRRDPDKEGAEVLVRQTRTTDIAPGNWEILVSPPEGSYVRDMTVSDRKAESRSKSAMEGWVLGRLGNNPNYIRITTSSKTAAITGRVLDKPNEPVPYAPVFLETMNLEPPDPPIVRQARAGADGNFQFQGLPPGKYRLLSSFDLDPSDRAAMEAAHPAEVPLNEGGSALQDLSLYHRP